MPIRPEVAEQYPPDWPALSNRIRFERAGGRCECRGECGSTHPGGRCGAQHGAVIQRFRRDPALWRTFPGYGSGMEHDREWFEPVTVVLTTAHRDHDRGRCDDGNLFAVCQRCHLRYDNPGRGRRRREEGGQFPLFAGLDHPAPPPPSFPNPVAHRADPVTSHEAAEEVEGNGTRATQAEQVLALCRRFPGYTSAELAEASRGALTLYAVRRRLNDLHQDEPPQVRQGEPRLDRATGGKRRAVTWWPAEDTIEEGTPCSNPTGS
jgi:hypothetical protein